MSTARVPRLFGPLAVAAAGALTLAGLATPAVSASQPGGARAAAARVTAAAPAPGVIGAPIALTNQAQFAGYDVATDSRGKTYVGWISATGNSDVLRTVHLCVIPGGSLGCAGGVQSTASLGPSSAEGLKIVVDKDDDVNLVWFHDTDPGSVNGPRGGRIAASDVTAAGHLTPAVDLGDAPSFGSLLDARTGPDQRIWTLAAGSSGARPLEVRDGAGAAAKVSTPWPYTGIAQLSFAGRTPVIVVGKAGAVINPLAASYRSGASWTAFKNIAGTWTVGSDMGVVATSSGLRLIASVNNASYFPVVSHWTGSGFSKPTLIGDRNNCAPVGHDPGTDASGRVYDVTVECDQIAVSNLQDTAHASIVRFSTRGTIAAGSPQIASTSRGRAIVAWTVETSNAANPDRLYIAAVRLGDLTVSKTKAVRGGAVTLTGPVSCLPAVAVPLGVRARGTGGWRATSTSLKLNGSPVGARTINGAALTPGASYTLLGSATFARKGLRAAGSVALVFRACPRP